MGRVCPQWFPFARFATALTVAVASWLALIAISGAIAAPTSKRDASTQTPPAAPAATDSPKANLHAEPNRAGLAIFENDVRPLLLEQCVSCHGPDKQKGGLRLDSPAWIKRGGEGGPLFEPGKPDASLIIKAVRYHDPELKMPPKRKLSEQAITSLERWVARGAAMPKDDIKLAAKPDADGDEAYDWKKWRTFWSFRPIQKPPLPPIDGDDDDKLRAAWSSHPIDQFLLAKLQAAGITPSKEADRYTLIRRATLDLIGLPPTPEEVEAFVNDRSPDAWEKIIDRLLASPHYGERWGRHWLDLARYVQGGIKVRRVLNAKGGEAFRDYVVRSFNADKPYDQFIREQLAGDLLPVPADALTNPKAKRQTLDQIIAPSFLSLGYWFEECPDPNRLRLDMINEALDTTTRTFMGLTVSCARCHDHKFDPVPEEDYYALAGVFRSTRILDKLNESWKDGRLRHVRLLTTPDERVQHETAVRAAELKLDSVRADIAKAYAEVYPKWRADAARYRSAIAALQKQGHAIEPKQWKAARIAGQVNLKLTPVTVDGEAVEIVETAKPYASWVRYMFHAPEEGDYVFEARYAADRDIELGVKVGGEYRRRKLHFRDTGGWGMKHLRWARVGTIRLREGYTAVQWHQERGVMPRLLTIRIYKDDPDRFDAVADYARKHKLNLMLLWRFMTHPLIPYPTVEQVDASYLDYAVEPELREAKWGEKERSAREAVKALQREYDALPKVIAVTDMPGKKVDMPVHIGGAIYHTSKETVPRGVLRITDHLLPAPRIPHDQSGRLQLADWLIDKRHPLTARVMVNRIWHWHFGRGIVKTTSDFGSRGDPPTHPKLLDYLGARFMGDGWSIKAMHRLIMTSMAYRQAGAARGKGSKAMASDPNNTLLWRFNSRRLEAEAIYDGMLASVATLTRQPSGQPLDWERSADRAMYVLTSGRSPAGLGEEIRKMFPLFGLEHEALMVSERDRSPTPAQSLWWLNNPLPKHFALQLAKQTLAEHTGWAGIKTDELKALDGKRITRMYQLTLGRPPTSSEAASIRAYLAHCRRYKVGLHEQWQRVALAIYSSNEFRYLP